MPIVSKFTETLWRFTFYFFIYIYGSFVMYNSTYFWDNAQVWVGYPRQELDDSMKSKSIFIEKV
jgi:hypothetical protein